MSISNLITRLEGMTGPDREVDVRLLAVTQPGEWSDADIEYACSAPERTVRCPHYTSSLDAAMSLVPEGMEKELSDLYGIARAAVGLNFEGGPFYGEHNGCSLPIALCIASLRARMSCDATQEAAE